MALYSTVKYKSIRGAGFRKEADLSSLRSELRGQMDRKIGKIGDGGILDEINKQLELFPGISKQALAKNFMYYSNSQNIDKYYYLTLNELLLLKYDEYISELGSSKKKGKKDEKEKKEKKEKK